LSIKTPNDRTLISRADFVKMAKQGAKADDFSGYTVFKASGTVVDKAAKEVGGLTLGPNQIGFILSNANKDREGDSIAVQGWQLAEYNTNPVVLWAHDHAGLPVGKAIKTFIDQDGQLKALDEFVARDVYAFAATVYSMIQLGFLNACSVGFQPQEWDMGDGGVDFKVQSLLEHSVCPVPAHPQALVIARAKGIDVAPLKDWAEKTLDLFVKGRKLSTLEVGLRKQVETLRAQSDPTGRKIFSGLCEVALALEDDEHAVLVLTDDAPGQPSTGPFAPIVDGLGAAANALASARTAAQMLADTDDVDSVLDTVASSCEGVIGAINAVRAAVAAAGGQPAPQIGAEPKRSAKRGSSVKGSDLRAAADLRRAQAVLRSGARHSAADVQLLQAAHDSLVALGASCPPPPVATAGDKTSLSIEDGGEGLEISADEVRQIVERVLERELVALTGKLP
jgi:HK97 family phage prohead protease